MLNRIIGRSKIRLEESTSLKEVNDSLLVPLPSFYTTLSIWGTLYKDNGATSASFTP